MEIRKKHPLLSKIVSILLTIPILLAYISLTNPSSVALPLLIIPFVLVGYLLYGVTDLFVCLFLGGRRGHVARMVPASVGAVGVMMLVLSSLHQLTWKDTLLVVIFIGLFWLYVWRADFLHENRKN